MNLPAVPEGNGEGIPRKQAELYANSKLIQAHFAKDPASVQYIGAIGKSLGIDPVLALSQIHVFKDKNGRLKASLSATLMASLAHHEGHYLHVEGDGRRATATLIRKEANDENKLQMLKNVGLDPSKYFVFTDTWTRERVENTPELKDKANYKNYGPEMLRARAAVGVVRMGAPECLSRVRENLSAMGMILNDDVEATLAVTQAQYTADELGAETDADGVPVDQVKLSEQERREKMVERALPFAESSPAQKIIEEIYSIRDNDDLSRKERAIQIQAIHRACKEKDRLMSPISSRDGESRTLQAETARIFEELKTKK